MPGLNQLKRFNQDMLAMGDEARKRATRGEKPITVPIPATVKDADDSDDFALGMPEGVSDMNGGVAMTSAEASSVDAPARASSGASDADNNTLDVSDLLGGLDTPDASEIDFSQFEDPPADAANNGDEGAATSPSSDASGSAPSESADEAEAIDELFGTDGAENADAAPLEAEPLDAEAAEPMGADSLDAMEAEPLDTNAAAEATESADEAEPVEAEAEPLEAESADEAQPIEVDGAEAIADEVQSAEPIEAAEATEAELAEASGAEPIPEPESDDAALFDDGGEINMNEQFPQGLDNVIPDPASAPEESAEAAPQGEAAGGAQDPDALSPTEGGAADDFDVDDLLSGVDFGDGAPSDSGEASDAGAPSAEETAQESPIEEAPTGETPAESAPVAADDFNVDDALAGLDFGDEGAGEAPAESAPSEKGLAEGVSAEAPVAEEPAGETPVEEAATDEMPAEETTGAEDAGILDADVGGKEAAPEMDEAGEEAAEGSAAEGNEAETPPTADTSGLNLDMDDAGAGSTPTMDIGDALSGLDFDNLDADTGKGEEAPVETFNAPEMEGMDFSADAAQSGFELDDDALHIPGFTDTDTAADVHGGSKQTGRENAQTPESSGLPPNTLTEAQYEKFKENFAQYPLNVRQAFENMAVQNEFTDDAQFEVVDKILKKAPARQVASQLERMLDISIPVPRDYERRTASEYEAYKSSFRYQLYNRIIPAALVCLAGVLLAVGLFMFGRKFIYRPIVANNLYKQGYTLLEADEYPQSEAKFVEATKYKMVKKWFYKYAHGYREHKQYQRAEKMYRNILYCFNHDKQAGIEYAQMECYDLANYEKAEEVARREVLDYHINDVDGILLLGDVFLEWGTEKDSSKFEEAKLQYALLMQLYGPSDQYMSRMMRYFIRTDNLREVLPLKEHFYTSKKAHLGAEDWTELSGFMLDKLYGPLSPLDEELRIRIEDVMDMLRRAVQADPMNPVAMYNLSRYFVKRNSSDDAKSTLTHTIELFNAAQRRTVRDMYKELDTYRLLGEEYAKGRDYIKAQEIYTDGITLYEKENRNSGFAGDENVGRLYADAGDIDYFIRGNMEGAYNAYTSAVETNCDTPSLRYRLGYIHYNKDDYDGAIDSFIKASVDNPNDMHLLLAMANTLSLRGDNYGAQSYYQRLVNELDTMSAQKGILLPQVRSDQAEIVNMYLKASNNLGVTLGRLARRTGNSRLNADAMVNLTTSMRAWDALTRNQATMVRLSSSNLAEQNLQYMARPESEFEPAIYTDIPRILTTENELHQ